MRCQMGIPSAQSLHISITIGIIHAIEIAFRLLDKRFSFVLDFPVRYEPEQAAQLVPDFRSLPVSDGHQVVPEIGRASCRERVYVLV